MGNSKDTGEETAILAVSAGPDGLSTEAFLLLLQTFVLRHDADDQGVVNARLEAKALLAFAARSHGIDPDGSDDPMLPSGVKLESTVRTSEGRRLAKIAVNNGRPESSNRQKAFRNIFTGPDGCQFGSHRTGEGKVAWREVWLQDLAQGAGPA